MSGAEASQFRSPDELLTLSLHEVTDHFGLDGIVNRLWYEIAEARFDGRPAFDRPGIIKIDTAVEWTLFDHRGQLRDNGDQYATHPLRVGARLVGRYDIHDIDTLVAALLHDTIEDNPGGLLDIGAREPRHKLPDSFIGYPNDPELSGNQNEALALIAKSFGHRCATIVHALTVPEFKGSDSLARPIHYRAHVLRALKSNPAARIVKLSDFTDNTHFLGGDRDGYLARKYLGVHPTMQRMALDPTTPFTPEGRQRAVEDVDLAEQRCLEVLGS